MPRDSLMDKARAAERQRSRPASPPSPDDPAPPANVERFKPFPVDALPQPIRRFVAEGAAAIGCDPSYVALPLLVSLASAIGTSRKLELKRGWYVVPILWAVIVGESGTLKTPPFKLAMRPVRERQRLALARYEEDLKAYMDALAQWEKDMAAWKRSKDADEKPPKKPIEPVAMRYVVSDTTVEALVPILLGNPRGIILARDELAGWIGSFDRYAAKGKAGADAAHWLSMFNAENVIVDRKTGFPRTLFVPQAAVSVTGGIQPGTLYRVLGSEHRESGLAARLLFSFPPRHRKQWTEANIDPQREAELVALFDRLYELQAEVVDDGEYRAGLVRLHPKAKAVWVAYYGEHASEQVELSGDLAAAWSKLEEYAARLALVVHFARWAANERATADPDVLDAASMTAGIALAAWFKGEAKRVYGVLDESEAERDHRNLVEWVERKGGSATARAVQQGCRWLREPGKAEAALDALALAGVGAWESAEPTAKGGRPARVFRLVNFVNVYETSEIVGKSGGSVDVDNVDTSETHTVFDPEGLRLFPEYRGLPD